MFTVALVGADGAGKTTAARKILEESALPLKYVYMGANPESSNLLLPTTFLAYKLKQAREREGGKPALRDNGEEAETDQPKKGVKRVLAAIKPYFWVGNRIAEEWFRQFVVWSYLRRGFIVLFDRHFFFDYYAYDIVAGGQGRPLPRRFHGWMLDHLYPKPDLVIFLDAPAGILFARKPEATLAYLERRREEYLQHRERFSNFKIVDAEQPQEIVIGDILGIIENFYRSQKNKKAAAKPHASGNANQVDGG